MRSECVSGHTNSSHCLLRPVRRILPQASRIVFPHPSSIAHGS
ncbi:rCG60376 [Rattus norvegicus]|uniref:RCG60376 n=1 Tax=Rattus norvegicus TaxID=10116 RepID=A6KKC4_RAT|nr:rCG60376 [Rattus norvegicus]